MHCSIQSIILNDFFFVSIVGFIDPFFTHHKGKHVAFVIPNLTHALRKHIPGHEHDTTKQSIKPTTPMPTVMSSKPGSGNSRPMNNRGRSPSGGGPSSGGRSPYGGGPRSGYGGGQPKYVPRRHPVVQPRYNPHYGFGGPVGGYGSANRHGFGSMRRPSPRTFKSDYGK